MNKIILDNKELIVASIELPSFIHGQEGSGASQFTISLAANLAKSGKGVIFFCAYAQGEEKLINEMGYEDIENVTIADPGSEAAFVGLLKESGQRVDYVIVKNIEKYSVTVFEQLLGFPNLILSGNFDEFKQMDILPPAKTKILFSESTILGNNQKLPPLNKYEGFLASESLSGKVSLEIK